MSTDNSAQDSHKSIIKSTSIISIGTLSSRILGFFRDIILAKILGTGFHADAFFVAFRIPNLFRDLVGEGATNAAVVPVLSEYKVKKEKEEFWLFASVILTIAVIILSILTILGIIFAPYIVKMIAYGFKYAEPEKMQLTIQLTKIMFPYLFFIGLTAYCIAILFTFRSFTAPAFSPCLLNLSIIVSAYLSNRYMPDNPVYGLAFGVILGGILQLLIQIKPLLKIGMKFKKPKTLRHSGALKVWKLLIPRLFGAGVYQLNVFVDTFCASLSNIIGLGGVSAIYYANRIIQFPMGVFGFALASATLPTLSGLASVKNIEQLKKTLIFTLENILFIMAPISIVIILLSTPIIRVLFERGEFNQYSTNITSWALLFYAVGLFSFGGIKILVTAFHALQDTKTPVKVAAGCLLLNVTLNILLMRPLKVGGIALASAISATVDFVILYFLISKKLGGMNGGIKKFVYKIIFSSGLTAVAIQVLWFNLIISNEVIKLFVVGISGLAVYGISCFILKIEQAQKIYAWARK